MDQAPPIFSHRWRMLAIAILAMIAIAVFKNAIKPWGMDFISF